MLLIFAFPGQTVRMEDHSDWWSILNENHREPDWKPKETDLGIQSFTIAGVSLEKDQIEQVEAKLGKTRTVQRGDASGGREQICYTSANGPEKIHLIFEYGEVESTFYLFAGGADWKGGRFCAPSDGVSNALSTASGLKLGLSREQVESILGKPDKAAGNKLVYFRETEKRTTAEEFERMRREYPEKLSDKDAHERFDSYTLMTYIEVRFVSSKTNYLAISATATN